ncbi:MAG: hypothetical protein GY810_16845 [Aureispira sp.]|nr:hypothetical protein [Aureispira sp.]
MELLDNDYVDEQSGEGLVVQHFDKISFWPRLVGLCLFFCSGVFWWQIYSRPYLNTNDYTLIFSIATVLLITGIAIWVFSLKQKKETKEIDTNTIHNLFKQQNYLWGVFIITILFFVLFIGYNLAEMVLREWDYSSYPMTEPAMEPEEMQFDEVIDAVEEVEAVPDIAPEPEEID